MKVEQQWPTVKPPSKHKHELPMITRTGISYDHPLYNYENGTCVQCTCNKWFYYYAYSSYGHDFCKWKPVRWYNFKLGYQIARAIDKGKVTYTR